MDDQVDEEMGEYRDGWKKVSLKSLAQTHMAEICNLQDCFFLLQWFSLYHKFWFVSFFAAFGD